MKSGVLARVRHRASACAAITLAVSLPLGLTACDDHSPVAAPTSTLPAQASTDNPSGEAESPSVPEYETELDLNDEEKEAVEGALVAFEGYFRTINSAYSGDFDVADEFPRYASGDALKSIEGDVSVIEDGSYEFTGTIVPSDIMVDSVSQPTDPSGSATVVIVFCFDLSRWSLSPKDEPTVEDETGFATMEHAITHEADTWRVSEQSLKEHKC